MKQKIVRRASALVLAGCLLAGAALPAFAASAKEEVIYANLTAAVRSEATTVADVINAIEYAVPAIEVIDSRVQNWAIDQTFKPEITEEERSKRIRGWEKAVKYAYGWARDEEN